MTHVLYCMSSNFLWSSSKVFIDLWFYFGLWQQALDYFIPLLTRLHLTTFSLWTTTMGLSRANEMENIYWLECLRKLQCLCDLTVRSVIQAHTVQAASRAVNSWVPQILSCGCYIELQVNLTGWISSQVVQKSRTTPQYCKFVVLGSKFGRSYN